MEDMSNGIGKTRVPVKSDLHRIWHCAGRPAAQRRAEQTKPISLQQQSHAKEILGRRETYFTRLYRGYKSLHTRHSSRSKQDGRFHRNFIIQTPNSFHYAIKLFANRCRDYAQLDSWSQQNFRERGSPRHKSPHAVWTCPGPVEKGETKNATPHNACEHDVFFGRRNPVLDVNAAVS